MASNWRHELTDFYQIQQSQKKIQIQTFKTVMCPFKGNRHNPKQCVFYHNSSDRKRTSTYSIEMCQNEICNDNCPLAHNRVEQLYSEERFKTKYCQFYPDNLESCPYQNFCSFVHDESEFTIPLLHKQEFDYDFFVYKFKTVWCPFTQEHNRQHCVYAHNPQDFRRELYNKNDKNKEDQKINYKMEECRYWNKYENILNYKDGGCPQMQNCKFSHGWKESDFHVNMFKTRYCNDGKKCEHKNFDCPFWHSGDDRISIKKLKNKFNNKSNNKIKKYKPQQIMSPQSSISTCYSQQSNSDQEQIIFNQYDLSQQRQDWQDILKMMDDFLFEGQTKIKTMQIFPLGNKNN